MFQNLCEKARNYDVAIVVITRKFVITCRDSRSYAKVRNYNVAIVVVTQKFVITMSR